MRFNDILHKNSICHLLRDYFCPPPQKKILRKEMGNIYVHFRRVFVEFVVLLTKIWPTNIDFSVTAKCWRERELFRGLFLPPPPFTIKSDHCNLSCSF